MKRLLLFPILFLWSCSQSASNEEAEEQDPIEKPAVIKKRIVGRIASVSSTGTFVLIQKYGNGSLPKEAVFQSQGNEGRQASLRPSGERIRDFFAADLLSGTAKIGDAVVAYHTPKQEKSVPEVEPPTPSSDEPEAPKKLESPAE
ncbi:hypothetical protein V2O64_00405 [Verrucomicrobiaceae bacterium 227]